MAVEMSPEEFEECVRAGWQMVPADLRDLAEDVAVQIADEPPPDQPATLLGLYEGVPLTERDSSWGFVPPDVITIFSGPLRRTCRDHDDLVDQIAVTVVHELAHHFGIDDERLHELGWG